MTQVHVWQLKKGKEILFEFLCMFDILLCSIKVLFLFKDVLLVAHIFTLEVSLLE